ncbi:MAG: hypothetical protein NZ770_08585, partial [Candidatus Poseidoniaceae archaeon]|nr:hypothetical protein [Candidatus Poseidoniaceae archaeon]
LTANPLAQEVAKGETAEYTITVKNSGSNSVTVQLSSSQGDGCNGFTSQVDQISGSIDAGASETTNLRVNVTEGAAESCETTVTAIANEQVTPPDQPGSPAQEEITVTTSVDGDESNEMWAVELETAPISRDWEGENMVTWEVEVKNTGRMNATINLEVRDGEGSGCDPLELEAELSETTMQIDNDSSEWVDLDVSVPSGQQAKKQCWNIHAEVQDDPQQNASDDLEVNLNIPELHECTSELADGLLNIDPGETKSSTVTYTNTGNTQWSVQSSISGSKAAWVSFDGASSGTLPYDTADDTKSFDFDVTPDDSLNVGDEVDIIIAGKDGNGPIKCQSVLVVRLGQSHGASVSLSTSVLSNVEPGANDSTSITVTNQGNGEEDMQVNIIVPDGWIARLGDDVVIAGATGSISVTVGSKHGSDKQQSVSLEVLVPDDALADEVITIPITVSAISGGSVYDSTELSVTVAATHGMVVTTNAQDQTGKSNEEVYFEFDVENTGNTADDFRFSVISQTAVPGWDTHFIWEDGESTPVTEVSIPARTTKTVILVVQIEDSDEELSNTRLTVRVTNKGDSNTGDGDGDGIPDNQAEMEFRAILSNQIFLMGMQLDIMWADEIGGLISLAPGGSETIPFWVENLGNYTDNAEISAELVGTNLGTIKLTDENGALLLDSIEVKKGIGVRNISTGLYLTDSEGLYVVFELSPLCDVDCATDKAWQYIFDNGLQDFYEAESYRVLVYAELSISSNAENGVNGIVRLSVNSINNMIDRVELDVSARVSTIKKIGMYHEGKTDVSIDYSKSKTFDVTITNEGNTEFEILVFTSEGLRGWVISLSEEEGIMRDGVFVAGLEVCDKNTDGALVCILDIGESVVIEIDVKPPHASEVSDEFEFTFSAEPTDSSLVGRKNIEFTVSGEPVEEGIFSGLPGFTTSLSIMAMFGAAALLWFRRRD